MYSDDPVRDFLYHDREQQRRANRRPKCSVCGEPIWEGLYVEKDDEPMCEECLQEEYGFIILQA
jgi:formylmethanofuran dehydrogenase subunit E